MFHEVLVAFVTGVQEGWLAERKATSVAVSQAEKEDILNVLAWL